MVELCYRWGCETKRDRLAPENWVPDALTPRTGYQLETREEQLGKGKLIVILGNRPE
jgi:hypothetical protein